MVVQPIPVKRQRESSPVRADVAPANMRAQQESTQMDDYDNDLEQYENEYLHEEGERQRLFAEMITEEDNVDVCTDGAVLFDVEAQMKELRVQRAPSNFKLNASAKEWKPRIAGACYMEDRGDGRRSLETEAISERPFP